MKKAKVLTLLLTASLVLGSFSGCAHKVNTSPDEISTEETVAETSTEELTSSEEETVNATEETENSTEESENEEVTEVDFSDLFAKALSADELPLMDGSTSLVPLGKALVAKLMGITKEEAENLISFNKTTQSYRNLMNGDCNLILASYPNEAVFDEMKEKGFQCDIEEISTEALIFVVNKDNPVDQLTTEQIVGIYSGQITNWSEVGGRDEKIDAFQRNVGSGSQALMDKLVMKDTPMMDAPEEYLIGTMGELMSAVKNYDNSSSAIGYSVYYYANDMKMAEGLKIIAVDGVDPNADTIRRKQYPHTNAYYCAIDGKKEADSLERKIYSWLVSEEGQAMVAGEGYVSIIDTGVESEGANIVENQFTRLQEERISDLKSGAYGKIFPFVGEHLSSAEGDYTVGSMYGFMTGTGCIIADPVYIEAYPLDYNDKEVGLWVFSKHEVDPTASAEDEDAIEVYYGVASFDGSYVSDCVYRYPDVFSGGFALYKDSSYKEYEFRDFQGNLLFDQNKLNLSEKDRMLVDLKVDDMLGMIDFSDNTGYFIDYSGNIIAGPFDNVERMENRYVFVTDGSEDGEHYGAMNLEGKMVVATEYSNVYYSDGYLVAYKDESEKRTERQVFLYDCQGNLMDQDAGGISYFTDQYGYYTKWNYEDNQVKSQDYYDKNGKLVYSILPNENVIYQYIVYAYNDKGVTITNKVTGESAFIEGGNDAYAMLMHFSDSNEYYVDKEPQYYYVYKMADADSESMMYILDSHFNVITATDSARLTKDVLQDQIYLYDYDYETQKSKLFTEQGECIVKDNIGSIAVFNGGLMITNEFCTKYYDKDNNLIFCYSLLKSAAE